MKQFLFFCAGLAFSAGLYAQTFSYLDINNVKARFWSDGDMFWDKNSTGSYEWPQGSGHQMSYTTGLWLVGRDASGIKHGAALRYSANGRDYHPGPLKMDGTIDANTEALYDQVWKITKAEVDQYILCHCQNPSDPSCAGYTIPNSILKWPGNPIVESDGDHQQMNPQLAPFHDDNNDGVYDPIDCDYPKFPCDQAVFFVYNDAAAAHLESQLPPMRFDVRALAYACSCGTVQSVLNDAVFLEMEVINYDTTAYHQSMFGLFADGEIGDANDDFAGTRVDEGYVYFYNGDAVDASYPQTGITPAHAVVLLEGPYMNDNGADDTLSTMAVIGYTDTTTQSGVFSINGTGFGDAIPDNERLGLTRSLVFTNGNSPTGDPANAQEYDNYLRTFWRDGTAMVYGGYGYPAGAFASAPRSRFFAPGNSDPLNWGTSGTAVSFDWSEAYNGDSINTPGDRRALLGSGPVTLQPGERNKLVFAFVSAMSGNTADSSSLDSLHHAVLDVKQYYFSQQLYCNGYSSTDEPEAPVNLQLYPNPAQTQLWIMATLEGETRITVTDIAGRVVLMQQAMLNGQAPVALEISTLAPGMYTVLLSNGKLSAALKFIKQ